MQLRPYQQYIHDCAIEFIKDNYDPMLIDAAPAAGKSFIVAALARTLHKASGGKKVLCLQPSKELVEQNVEKFRLTGEPCSIFSASAGSKCMRHPVIYGTRGSVKNSLSRFGDDICAVIVDEAHELAPTDKFIIEKLREKRPKLRVIGLSGTPYRLGQGYIYRVEANGDTVPEDRAKDPYFLKCVARVSARDMLEDGFLTPMQISDVNCGAYDVSQLEMNGKKFTEDSLHKVFVGQGRKTAVIVADVVNQTKNRFGGVMLFASTREHAREIMDSLPPNNSVMVDGSMKKRDREQALELYRQQKRKYLVSVNTLVRGFDVDHTSSIALLRATESSAMLQQILGRAWRLHDDKPVSYVLDYAGNLENHFPEGDIYVPEIKAYSSGESHGTVSAVCEDCGTVNQFSARKNDEGYAYDEQGYFVDLEGNQIQTDDGPIPGHYGRRCQGMVKNYGNTHHQCGFRWNSKQCPECGEDNDIAARYCSSCRAEIIDPNEKLIVDFKRYKKDPTNIQTDEVLAMNRVPTVTKRGEECLRVDYTTEYRSFSIWYFPDAPSGFKKHQYQDLIDATNNFKNDIHTITYKKDSKSGFFKVFGYNDEIDRL